MVGKIIKYTSAKGVKMLKIIVKESVFESEELEVYGDKEKGGLDKIELSFNSDNKVMTKELNLYTYQRIKKERENGYDSGYSDGYSQGLIDGEKAPLNDEDYQRIFDEGYQKALADIEAKKQENKKTGTVKNKEGRKPEISDEKIKEILHDAKTGSSREVAAKHRISRQTVLNIVNGKGRFRR